eukprot:5384956-Amphidinium_carterae.1
MAVGDACIAATAGRSTPGRTNLRAVMSSLVFTDICEADGASKLIDLVKAEFSFFSNARSLLAIQAGASA